jgi:hypothetical protein
MTGEMIAKHIADITKPIYSIPGPSCGMMRMSSVNSFKPFELPHRLSAMA